MAELLTRQSREIEVLTLLNWSLSLSSVTVVRPLTYKLMQN